MALEQDAALINAALRDFPQKARPQLKKAAPQREGVQYTEDAQGPEADLREEDDIDGPMIVRLGCINFR